jgi:uncharacterized protein with ParB-like and HNH nuclease domain
MIRSVGQTPLYDLLSTENNVVYEVPAYQREYSWGKEQWDALFDDLLEEPSGQGHFLGTIICVNKTADTTKQSVLELVDGQQRMTTLSILLLAVYKLLQSNEKELSEDERTDLVNLKRMLCLKNPTRQRISLQTQNNNFNDYVYLLAEAGFEIEKPKVSHVGLRRISKALQHFSKRIQDYVESRTSEVSGNSTTEKLLSFFERVKQSILVKLEVESHTDAFVLFESLNNRGLPLTPIDLIKTNLLSTADKVEGLGVDDAYKTWKQWVELLGDDYGNQERFFRQFYNAFKTDWELAQPNIPIATRTKLIQIYESLMKSDIHSFIARMNTATEAYGRILGNLETSDPESKFDLELRDLPRAQGVPAYMLILFLSVNAERFGLDDEKMAGLTSFLTNFSIRRNLTNTPPTYDLDRIFINLIDDLMNSGLSGESLASFIKDKLIKVSANDAVFEEQLRGPIYDENTAVTRYILTAMARQGMTKETEVDLWQQTKVGGSKDQYVWTIEHVLPQGENLPEEWVEMLGGRDSATRIQRELVHTIGNLTISGYNSKLGNKSFQEKRDRTNEAGNFVGYKNNLNLNSDLKSATEWEETSILARTDLMSKWALELFKLQ